MKAQQIVLKKHRKNFPETTFISYILVGASPPPDRKP